MKEYRELNLEAPDTSVDLQEPLPRGIKGWRNKNGFVVVAVHYTADPKKCSNEWYTGACSKLRPDQVERELEINFDSKAGTKAFPFLEHNECVFRADPPDPIPPHWKILVGMDYGARNPTSIHWYAIDENKCFWVFDEFYQPLQSLSGGLPELCKYLKGHKYWERCSKVVADPKIFAKDQNIITKETGQKAWGTIKSIAEMMMDEGIYKVQRGNNDRIAGLTRINTMLNWRGSRLNSRPMVLFGTRAKKMWWELCNIVYKLDDTDTKNPEEDVVKRNDHAFDELKYSLLSEDIPPEFIYRSASGGMTLAEGEAKMDEDRLKKENKDQFSCTFRDIDGNYEEEYA